MNPRTFLALHVVFGRACGAASTTFQCAPMQVKLRFPKKRPQYYTKNAPKSDPKYLQNGAKKAPKTIPETLPKKGPKKYPKVLQRAPQNDPKKEPKITKNGLGGLFFTSEKL